MIARALTFRRSGSRRTRPPRFPAPGYPRGASARGRRVAGRPSREVRAARAPRRARTRIGGADFFAAAATVAGVFLWGGLLVLLAA